MAFDVAQRGSVFESGLCVLNGATTELRENDLAREIRLGVHA